MISAFDVHHVLGARRSALHRAAEVYAEHVLPLPISTDDDPTPRIDPSALAIASGTPAGPVEAWTAARALGSDRTVLVPAAAVHTFGAYNSAGLYVATSAGTGAAGSPGEALGRGLLGALGYEALTRAVRGTHAATRVPLDALEADPELKFLVSSAGNLDVDLELLDLPTPAGFAVLARAVDPDGGAPLWALGSAVAWPRAALEAIRDLLGGVQLRRELDADDELDTGDPLLRALDPYSLAVDGRHPVDLAAETGWPALLDGLHVLTVPIAAPDLAQGGVWVARTLLLGRD